MCPGGLGEKDFLVSDFSRGRLAPRGNKDLASFRRVLPNPQPLPTRSKYIMCAVMLTTTSEKQKQNIMSDQQEEQEMEAEALAAIFDTAFEIRSSEQPFVWAVKLVPVDCGGDADEEEAANHVMVKLVANIPLEYPETTLPQLDLEIIKGLSQDNKNELLQLANDEAGANAGMPAIFAVCEAVRAWLADNNVKGLDDASMHAQMMRKAKEAERREVRVAATLLLFSIDIPFIFLVGRVYKKCESDRCMCLEIAYTLVIAQCSTSYLM